ncbi:MAG: Rieske (2Fe-2S) protein [Egibacteraceae bacterium]
MTSRQPDLATGERVRVGTVAELEADGLRVVPAGQATVVVFWHAGRPYAMDNRCPHLGFPLHRGTVRDGVVTCHWHHAKFDLAGGCTFDAFADDARAYPAAVEDGVVWVGVAPVPRDERAHHLRKLDEGLEHGLDLVLAKAVLGLDGEVAAEEVIARGARFGIRNRSSGWSDGLSILVALANLRPHLAPEDRGAALFHGLSRAARSTAGQPPSFDLAALDTDVRDPEQLTGWFRRFCEVRADGAAERTLRSATTAGLPPYELVALLAAACTDHRFLDVGHALDFANKAFELLDHIGWAHADEVLPALIPVITGGRRMEETSAWRHPVDLAVLVAEAAEGVEAPPGSAEGWDGHARLAGLVLDGEPAELLAELGRLIRDGVPVVELSAAVAYAAALRLVHFPTTNEQGDWDTVHHVFTYANAVDQMLRRAPTTALLRGLLDAAAAVHLERFLNVPKRPVPRPSGQRREPADLLVLFDRHGAVDEVAQLTCDLLAAGRATEVVRTLGHALMREDATFHCYQVLEAAVRQRGNLAGTPAADHVLIAAARFLAAQFPTVRSRARTWDVARRLHRGETLHDDADL